MKPSADVITLLDDALEDAAALRLRVSQARCRAAVDDLLGGYGPNPGESVHQTDEERDNECRCGCYRAVAERQDLILTASNPLVGRERTRWDVTYLAAGDAEGNVGRYEPGGVSYQSYEWDAGEREEHGNFVQPSRRRERTTTPPHEPEVVTYEANEGFLEIEWQTTPALGHTYSYYRATSRFGVTWDSPESVDITRTIN